MGRLAGPRRTHPAGQKTKCSHELPVLLHRTACPPPEYPALPSLPAAEEVEVPPELCMVCPVPLALWPALAVLPRLLWQADSALHAAELRHKLVSAGLAPER